MQRFGFGQRSMIVAAIGAAALFLAACQPRLDMTQASLAYGRGPVEVSFPTLAPSAKNGAALYARACAGCTAAQQFSDPAFIRDVRRGLTPWQLYQAVSDGNERYGLRALRSALTPDERWDVVFYLWSLGSTPAGRAEGAQLFAQNCAMCHGPRGGGDGDTGKHLQPLPANFQSATKYAQWNDVTLFQFISAGKPGTAMPPWSNVLTADQRWTIVDFLRTLIYKAGD